jgi:hypothetical protein
MKSTCKKMVNSVLYVGCLCVILFAVPFAGCTPVLTQSVTQKNHGLVELCVSSQIAPHKTPFLLRKLSQESPAIDTISYDGISLSSSLPFFTPYTYGYNHYEKVYASMNIQREGIPRTIYQRQSDILGIPKDADGNVDWELWIEEAKEIMAEVDVPQNIRMDSFSLSIDKGFIQGKCTLHWTGEMSQDDIQNLRYSLFLKADRIYLYEFNDEHCFADNLAYDLVPLKGDIKEEYDGIGFSLFSSSDEYPTKENPYITLSTEPFSIPFIEGFTEEQQPNWSLHLILNDGTNLSKNLYSWSFPINGEENQ